MAKFYEEIVIELVPESSRERKYLHKQLLQFGFSCREDFYKVLRTDKVEEWQPYGIFDITTMRNGQEIYETEEDIEEGISTEWDKLKINYLLASLPEELIDVFLDKIYELKNILDVKLLYEGKAIAKADLRDEMFRMAKEMEEKYAPVGSDSLDTLMSLEHQGIIILD